MRFCRYFPRLLSALIALALGSTASWANGPLPPPKVEWVPGELVVKLRQMRSILDLDRRDPLGALNAQLGVWSVDQLSAHSPEWIRLRFDVNQDVNAAAARYRELAAVELADPNYIFRLVGDATSPIRPSFTPNDPSFSSQWGLTYIQAPQAWDITQGSASQIIAIIDTGVDLNHPDLANKLWTNPIEAPGDKNNDGCPGYCGVDDDSDGRIDEDGGGKQPGTAGYDVTYASDDDENGYRDDLRGWDFVGTGSGIEDNDPQDDGGHGTHCAAIAAAATHNGVGIAGVCPDCRIMPVKAFLANGSSDSTSIKRAIDYARLNGATVISMSFTSPADAPIVSQALYEAYSMTGRVAPTLVAAAGNDRLARSSSSCPGLEYPVQPIYPAHYWFVIGVEAIDSNGSLANFSNCGYSVKAPGVGILSAVLDNSYTSWSGTSMAAPYVAGVAGLLRSVRESDPNWNAALIHTQIVTAAGNAHQALTLGRKPKIQFASFRLADSSAHVPAAAATVTAVPITARPLGSLSPFTTPGILPTASPERSLQPQELRPRP